MTSTSGKSGCCVDKECTAKTCMDLAPGETCGTCRHFERCRKMGFTSAAERTSCDFFPRRYLPVVREAVGQ